MRDDFYLDERNYTYNGIILDCGAMHFYVNNLPFLKPGGILVLHNSSERIYEEGHDGHHQLVLDYLRAPNYTDIHCVRTTTFARLTESLQ